MPSSERAGAGGDEPLDRRDGAVAAVLGLFFVVLGLPVLAGTFFAGATIDRVINVVAGLLILAVGAAFLLWARRLVRRA